MTPAKVKPTFEARSRRALEADCLEAERRYRSLVGRADFIERQSPSPRSQLWEELSELTVERRSALGEYNRILRQLQGR
jgi:hypothetical protein